MSATTDLAWNQVRVGAPRGDKKNAVYMDGSSTPLVTATGATFRSGQVGLGSFDTIGRLRTLTVSGTAGDG